MNRHYLREDEDFKQRKEGGLTEEQTQRFTQRGGWLLVYAVIVVLIVVCVAAKV